MDPIAERCKKYGDIKAEINKNLDEGIALDRSLIVNYIDLIQEDFLSEQSSNVIQDAAFEMLEFLMDILMSTTSQSVVITFLKNEKDSNLEKVIANTMKRSIIKLIDSEHFKITQYINLWKGYNLPMFVDVMENIYQNDLPSIKYKTVFLNNIIPELMNLNINDDTRNILIDICFNILPLVPSSDLTDSEFEEFKSNVINNYVKTIVELRDKQYENWHRLWIFVIKFCHKRLHFSVNLTNHLLRIVEFAFRNPSCHQRLQGYDCWIELIDNASLNPNYISSNKQLKLLVTPLKAKYFKQEAVIIKRFEVFVHLLEKLSDKAVLCLTEFLEFCFGPVGGNSDPNKTGQAIKIQSLWKRIAIVLMEILGHQDNCIEKEFKFDLPVLNDKNIGPLCKVVIKSINECCILLNRPEFNFKRDTIIRCLWTSLFNILNSVSDEIRQNSLESILLVLNSLSQDFSSFKTVLNNIFYVLISNDSKVTNMVFKNASIYLIPIVFDEISTEISYDQKNFQAIINNSMENIKNFKFYLNCFTDIVPQEKINLKMACDFWLAFAKYILLDMHKNDKHHFASYLLWPVQYFHQIEEYKLKEIENTWVNVLKVVSKESEANKIDLLDKTINFIKSNSFHMPNIIKTLYLIVNNEENFNKEFVHKIMEVISLIVSLPILENEDKENLSSIIILFLNPSLSVYAETDNTSIISKLCFCLEKTLKIHTTYNILKSLLIFVKGAQETLRSHLSKSLTEILNSCKVEPDSADFYNIQMIILLLDIKTQKPTSSSDGIENYMEPPQSPKATPSLKKCIKIIENVQISGPKEFVSITDKTKPVQAKIDTNIGAITRDKSDTTQETVNLEEKNKNVTENNAPTSIEVTQAKEPSEKLTDAKPRLMFKSSNKDITYDEFLGSSSKRCNKTSSPVTKFGAKMIHHQSPLRIKKIIENAQDPKQSEYVDKTTTSQCDENDKLPSELEETIDNLVDEKAVTHIEESTVGETETHAMLKNLPSEVNAEVTVKSEIGNKRKHDAENKSKVMTSKRKSLNTSTNSLGTSTRNRHPLRTEKEIPVALHSETESPEPKRMKTSDEAETKKSDVELHKQKDPDFNLNVTKELSKLEFQNLDNDVEMSNDSSIINVEQQNISDIEQKEITNDNGDDKDIKVGLEVQSNDSVLKNDVVVNQEEFIKENTEEIMQANVNENSIALNQNIEKEDHKNVLNIGEKLPPMENDVQTRNTSRKRGKKRRTRVTKVSVKTSDALLQNQHTDGNFKIPPDPKKRESKLSLELQSSTFQNKESLDHMAENKLIADIKSPTQIMIRQTDDTGNLIHSLLEEIKNKIELETENAAQKNEKKRKPIENIGNCEVEDTIFEESKINLDINMTPENAPKKRGTRKSFSNREMSDAAAPILEENKTNVSINTTPENGPKKRRRNMKSLETVGNSKMGDALEENKTNITPETGPKKRTRKNKSLENQINVDINMTAESSPKKRSRKKRTPESSSKIEMVDAAVIVLQENKTNVDINMTPENGSKKQPRRKRTPKNVSNSEIGDASVLGLQGNKTNVNMTPESGLKKRQRQRQRKSLDNVGNCEMEKAADSLLEENKTIEGMNMTPENAPKKRQRRKKHPESVSNNEMEDAADSLLEENKTNEGINMTPENGPKKRQRRKKNSESVSNSEMEDTAAPILDGNKTNESINMTPDSGPKKRGRKNPLLSVSNSEIKVAGDSVLEENKTNVGINMTPISGAKRRGRKNQSLEIIVNTNVKDTVLGEIKNNLDTNFALENKPADNVSNSEMNNANDSVLEENKTNVDMIAQPVRVIKKRVRKVYGDSTSPRRRGRSRNNVENPLEQNDADTLKTNLSQNNQKGTELKPEELENQNENVVASLQTESHKQIVNPEDFKYNDEKENSEDIFKQSEEIQNDTVSCGNTKDQMNDYKVSIPLNSIQSTVYEQPITGNVEESEDIIESSQETSICITPISSPKKISDRSSLKRQMENSKSKEQSISKYIQKNAVETTQNLNTSAISCADTVTPSDTDSGDSNLAKTVIRPVIKLDLPQKPDLTDSEKIVSEMDTVTLLSEQLMFKDNSGSSKDNQGDSTLVNNDVTVKNNMAESSEAALPSTPISKKNSLPTSPVTGDTPNKTKELLNDTLDISPISSQNLDQEKSVFDFDENEELKEDNLEVLNNPDGDENFIETPLHKRLLRMKTELITSPSNSRIINLISPFHQNKTDLEFDDDNIKEDVFTFSRSVPSPLAVPKSSILKRKLSDGMDDENLPCAKKKRVNFSHPATTSKKVILNESLESDLEDILFTETEGIETENSLEITNALLLENSKPIYSKLVDCTDDVLKLLKKMTSPMVASVWLSELTGQNIKTVGDLASKTEVEINRLPFKAPVVLNMYKALDDYYNKEFRHLVDYISDEMGQLEEIIHNSKNKMDVANVVLKMMPSENIKSLLLQYMVDFKECDLKETVKSYIENNGLEKIFQIISEQSPTYFDSVFNEYMKKTPLVNILENYSLQEMKTCFEDAIEKNVFSKQELINTCLIPLLKNPQDIPSYLNILNVVQLGESVENRIKSVQPACQSNKHEANMNADENTVIKYRENDLIEKISSKSSDEIVSFFDNIGSKLPAEKKKEVSMKMFKSVSNNLPESTLLELHIAFLKNINSSRNN